MINTQITSESPVKVGSVNGIDVYNIRSDRFKTNTISIFLQDDLNNERASKNALIPAVLRRGTKTLPTQRDISKYLEELYGAVFDCGVSKKGEHQILHFYIEYINDKYLSEGENLFEKSFELLSDIFIDPITENGIFKNEYVEQEKQNLKNLIESRINDKVSYAIERCFEEMCKDEPFGIYDYGTIEEVANIDGRELYSYYKELVKTLPISIYVTGSVDDIKIKSLMDKISDIPRDKIKTLSRPILEKEVNEVKHIEEKMNINQGKLSLGFRTNVNPGTKEYLSLMVYNGILGGGMHSKLFANVREKESLAYYAFSRLEKFKGLMLIGVGIEIQNRDKAYDIIMQQMEDIKNGEISDFEYQSTLKTIETGIKSLKDSQINIVDFYLGQKLACTHDTLDGIIEGIKDIKKSDVMAISSKIKLDSVYFLTAK